MNLRKKQYIEVEKLNWLKIFTHVGIFLLSTGFLIMSMISISRFPNDQLDIVTITLALLFAFSANGMAWSGILFLLNPMSERIKVEVHTHED